MDDHAVVVIGASAGGIPAVREIGGALPSDLDAVVLVIGHVPANATSALPSILSGAGPLPATHAVDGEQLVPGRVLVAPPDRHLVIADGVVRLTRTPRENNHRPSIDALFRSAAAAYGPRVMGVVASGALDEARTGWSRSRPTEASRWYRIQRRRGSLPCPSAPSPMTTSTTSPVRSRSPT